MVHSLSSQGIHHQAQRSLLLTHQRLQKATHEAQGGTPPTYDTLPPQHCTRALNLEKRFHELEHLEQQDIEARRHLQTMDQAVQTIQNEAKRLYQNLSAFWTGSHSTSPHEKQILRQQGQMAFQACIKALNTQDDQNAYVFSGQRTQTAPVDMTHHPLPRPQDPVNATYYQGDHAARFITEDISTINIRADHPAFAHILRASQLIAQAPESSESQPFYQSAMESLTKGIEGCTEHLSVLGLQMQSLESITEKKTTEREHIQDTMQSMLKESPEVTLNRWTELRYQLETILTTVSRLQQTNWVTVNR